MANHCHEIVFEDVVKSPMKIYNHLRRGRIIVTHKNTTRVLYRNIYILISQERLVFCLSECQLSLNLLQAHINVVLVMKTVLDRAYLHVVRLSWGVVSGGRLRRGSQASSLHSSA